MVQAKVKGVLAAGAETRMPVRAKALDLGTARAVDAAAARIGGSIVVFGREMCGACQEVKLWLREHGVPFDYFSLDTPTQDFDEDDPYSVMAWDRARLALAEATTYGLMSSSEVKVPVVIRRFAEPCEVASDAFERVPVLSADGVVNMSHLVDMARPTQEELPLYG